MPELKGAVEVFTALRWCVVGLKTRSAALAWVVAMTVFVVPIGSSTEPGQTAFPKSRQ